MRWRRQCFNSCPERRADLVAERNTALKRDQCAHERHGVARNRKSREAILDGKREGVICFCDR